MSLKERLLTRSVGFVEGGTDTSLVEDSRWRPVKRTVVCIQVGTGHIESVSAVVVVGTNAVDHPVTN